MIEITYAINNGYLEKPDRCEKCGKIVKVEAHHDDYKKPFKIAWVCRHCHSLYHNNTNISSASIECVERELTEKGKSWFLNRSDKETYKPRWAKEKMKKLIVELDESLKKEFDIACAKDGKNKRKIITMLIKRWMNEQELKA